MKIKRTNGEIHRKLKNIAKLELKRIGCMKIINEAEKRREEEETKKEFEECLGKEYRLIKDYYSFEILDKKFFSKYYGDVNFYKSSIEVKCKEKNFEKIKPILESFEKKTKKDVEVRIL